MHDLNDNINLKTRFEYKILWISTGRFTTTEEIDHLDNLHIRNYSINLLPHADYSLAINQ
jgi:hypothetical protein